MPVLDYSPQKSMPVLDLNLPLTFNAILALKCFFGIFISGI